MFCQTYSESPAYFGTILELEDFEPDLIPERLRRRHPEDCLREKQGHYMEKLDQCKDFRDIFQIVKRSVKETLGLERTGLMLYLTDMPMGVGAYHQVGSNSIVMNSSLLEHVMNTSTSRRKVNSFIYSILAHEYIHTLGCLDERRVRQLTYVVSRETFGGGHLATRMAAESPWRFIGPFGYDSADLRRPPRIVEHFEDIPFGYIS